MGIQVKSKNIDGVVMYQLRSTISDDLYHTEQWVTLDKAKKALMESKLWNLAESFIEIDMEFPHAYYVNGAPPKIFTDKTIKRYSQHALENYYGEDGAKKLDEDFEKCIKKYGVILQNPPEIHFGLYRVESDGNGERDKYTLVCASDTEEKLKFYCKETFNKEVGKPEIFSWDDYFVIQPYTINII